MPVPEQIPYVGYIANGQTTEFPITFDLHDPEFLIVTLNKEIPLVGAFTIDMNAKKVVFATAPNDSDQVELYRETELNRDIDYKSFDNSFRPEAVNYDLDTVMRILQEQNMIDAKIASKIKGEIEWRRTHDANFDELSKMRDAQIFSGLKQYLDTILAMTNPNIFDGIGAGIVFALDKKSVQTHLELIYEELHKSNQGVSEEKARALAAEGSLFEQITLETNRAKSVESDLELKISTSVGGIKYFETEAELLASTPTVSDPQQAKALDTKKVWIWKVGAWVDTGLSELDLAKAYSDEKIKSTDSLVYEFAITDENGNVALGINKEGRVSAQNIDTQEVSLKSVSITDKSLNDFSQVWVDDKGFIALGIRKNGSVYIPKLDTSASSQVTVDSKKRLSIGVDDCILHVGDSMTASHYCVQDKSYVSQLSQLSPFRHVNYGVSGNDLLNMQSRVLNDTKTFGATLKSMKPRFVFIASFANDGAYTNVDLTYYQENMRRLIDVCLGHGVQPVLITYFTMNSTQHQAVKAIADEYNIDVIHNDVLNKQVGTYNAAVLFHQGHTGTRNNGIWWMPMLDYIKQQKALKTIKIYRKRPSFAVTTDSDLLFKDQLDKAKKWKEIGIGHYSLANEYKYDELDSLTSADLTWTLRDDEYVKLADKSNVTFSDYALVEVKLDALIKNMQSIEIGLKSTGSIEAYVRNNLDKSTELARLPPTDPIYQSNWNKPRGAWRKVDIVGEKITIASDQLIYSTVGNTLFLMLKGSFNLSDLYIDYVSDKYESAPIVSKKKKDNLGSELVQQPYCGTTAQLNGWSVNGTITPIIPIDVLNAPRKNDSNQPIDGVVTLSAGNNIQQSVSFASSDDVRVFKVTAWARYYAKAYFDMTNSKYSSLDASQIIDRNQSGAVAPISKDTLDLRNLKIETWTETTYPVSGGADQQDYVGLQWRPVDFYIEVLPFETTLNIRLSATDSVQLAKLSVKEVL